MSDATCRRPLRISLPKGRLADDVARHLRDGGLDVPDFSASRQLTLRTADGIQEYILSKPTDVPTFVVHGGADIGFSGLDTLREEGVDVLEPFTLPIGICRISLAGPRAWRDVDLHLKDHLRVATKYKRIASDWFVSQGINAEVIKLNGSVELAPLTGLSDLIVDLVETGRTLQANGLVELQHVLDSRVVVIVNRSASRLRENEVNHFLACVRPVPSGA